MKRLVFRILLLAVTVGLALAILEVGLRRVQPMAVIQPPAATAIDPYDANPYILWARPHCHSHMPGAVYFQERAGYRVRYEINAMGFRGPDIEPKHPGVRRLLVTGDSMTEGHGVPFEATFPVRLNESLMGAGWQAINIGVQGGSPLYYAANAERFLALEPDVIMLTLFENDIGDDRFQEDTFFSRPWISTDLLALARREHGWFPSSRVLGLLRTVGQRLRFRHLNRLVAEHRRAFADHTCKDLMEVAHCAERDPALFEAQWAASARYLDYAVDTLSAGGVRVFVAYLALNFEDEEHPCRETNWAVVDDRVAAWARARGVPYCSLAPAARGLLERAGRDALLIRGDGHMTAAGHAVVADELRLWLPTQGVGN